MPEEAATPTPTPTAPKRRPSRHEAKCSVEGCKRPYRAKTYCVVHYQAWRRGEIEGHRARYKICTNEGCRKARFKGSLCEEHSKPAAAVAAPAA